ncbi:MAG: NADPH:quinone reductase [Chrysothrix sp. TS-e1954]|nr:MAG: NADPH:quinone reductase [Chrysothrix sp. TS-e1954]
MAASLPKTMKGVSISKNGGVDVLEYKTDMPVPTPKEGEVLVRNDIAGINYIDTYFRTGLYPCPSFPYTLGREAAGTLIAHGPGSYPSSLKQDSHVVFLATGAYAEYSAVSSIHTYALPGKVSSETAAASLLQGLTAITLIREAHHVESGDWVLVHAAAGGMGLWLCQLLKATGAHVIGTASTSEKRELASKAGAEVTLEYPESMGEDKFVAKVKELTGGQGVPVVFDGVGKKTFDTSLECVRRKGSMVSFGNASGAVDPFTISRLSGKNVKLMRPTLFNYIATREEFERYTTELFALVEQGKVDVTVHKTYDLNAVAQAHQDLEGRKTSGKLLLKV